MSEAQRIAGGSGSEQDVVEAKLELEVGRLHLQFEAVVPTVKVY